MPLTYEPIATTTLGADTASISFGSVPNTYTDLRLIITARTDRASTGSDTILLRFNNDAASNYSYTQLTSDGTTAATSLSASTTQILGGLAPRNNNTSGIFGLTVIDIFSYAGSTHKSTLATAYADISGSGNVYNIVGMWRNTSAITTVSIHLSSTFKYLTGTTATLYGIKAA